MRFLLATLLSGCLCVAPQHPDPTGRTEAHELASAAVGDTYRLWVRLPPGYDDEPTRRYPVIVQLDANLEVLEEFAVTAGHASALEASGEIPPVIVVGVGYRPGQQQPGRLRDYTFPLQHPDPFAGAGGGAPAFLAFLRGELFPHLEQGYRVAGPAGRALFGHSLGGLFTTWALLQHDAAAPLFSGYVAASPSLLFDEASLYAQLEARTADLPAAVSMTVGTLEGPEMNVYFDDFTRRLQERGFPGLTLSTRRYPTDHVGSVSPSFRDGLRFVFAHGLSEQP